MTKLVVILGFLVSFAAGLTVGWRTVPPATPAVAAPGDPKAGERNPDGGPRGPESWLTRELSLSAEQQGQMKQIWSEAAHEGRSERDQKRRDLRKERDDKISTLVAGSGKKDEFDQINSAYTQGVEKLEAEWRASFEQSVEKTKAILKPEQRTKYEEMLKRHAPPQGGGGGPPGAPPQGSGWDRGDRQHAGRRPETRATSRPADRIETPAPTSR